MFSFSPGRVFALHSHPLSRKSGLRARGASILRVTSVLFRPLASSGGRLCSLLRSVLSKFGQIKGLRHQSFPEYSNVKTGSRIVRMVVEREIPS